MGQPIRVSQALSVVMVVVAAVMLFYNIKIKKRTADGLLVNQVAAREAAALEEAPEELEILDTAERRTDEQEETDDGSEN